jgi:hypothetical protein
MRWNLFVERCPSNWYKEVCLMRSRYGWWWDNLSIFCLKGQCSSPVKISSPSCFEVSLPIKKWQSVKKFACPLKSYNFKWKVIGFTSHIKIRLFRIVQMGKEFLFVLSVDILAWDIKSNSSDLTQNSICNLFNGNRDDTAITTWFLFSCS